MKRLKPLLFISMIQNIAGQNQGVCQQPKAFVGDCRASIDRWTFDAKTDSCHWFTYGGCDGNDNNFESSDECFRQCGTEKTSLDMKEILVHWFGKNWEGRTSAKNFLTYENEKFEKERLKKFPKDGGNEENEKLGLIYDSSLYTINVERIVGRIERLTTGIVEVIDVTPDPRDEKQNIYKVWIADPENPKKYFCYNNYNLKFLKFKHLSRRSRYACTWEIRPWLMKTQSHKTFIWALRNIKVRATWKVEMVELDKLDIQQKSVEKIPKKSIPVCQQPKGVVGNCKALIDRWTFDAKTDSCQWFEYGGCDGNDNNFESNDECFRRCGSEDTSLDIEGLMVSWFGPKWERRKSARTYWVKENEDFEWERMDKFP